MPTVLHPYIPFEVVLIIVIIYPFEINFIKRWKFILVDIFVSSVEVTIKGIDCPSSSRNCTLYSGTLIVVTLGP